MRSTRNGAILLVFCAFAGVFSAAQQNKAATPATTKPVSAPQNLLLADDGLSVIAAALDARNRFSDKADCSHLVHDIYERAGFSYPYVPSTDLYVGVSEFRRVTRVQPGDLIVWPGHVGIVVSPTHHTFYSSLRSGLGVEHYDSDYWKQRGRPHFLRYVKDASTVAASNDKTPTLQSASLETSATEAASPSAAPLENVAVQFPRVLVVESARPTSQQVSATLINAMNQTADGLRGRNIFDLPQTIVVLSRIDVERIKIKGAAGWADVQVIQSASLADGQSNVKKRTQKQRWPLRRRDEQSWDLVLPQDAVYLNQDSAVRLLAQQLALMTDQNSSTDFKQKAQVSALLSSLLQVKTNR